MRSRSLSILFLMVAFLASCASSNPEEDAIVDYLMPKIFGDAERVEDLRPGQFNRIKIEFYDKGSKEKHDVITSLFNSKESPYLLGDEAAALNIFFRDRIFSVYWEYGDDFYQGNVSSAKTSGVNYYHKENLNAQELLLRRVDVHETNEWEAKRPGRRSYASIYLVRDKAPYRELLTALQARVTRANAVSKLTRLSPRCALYTTWNKGSLSRHSFLFYRIERSELNMGDDEDYACLSYLIAKQLDLRAIKNMDLLDLHFPSAKKVVPDSNSDCIVAKSSR